MHAPFTKTRFITSLVAAILVLGVAVVVGLSVGSSSVGGAGFVVDALLGSLTATERTIFFDARLPRVVFAVAVGASLACAGAVFQAVLRNPLADPYILGVSGGAALGATTMLTLAGTAFGALRWGVPGAAFVGALGAIALIVMVSKWGPGGRMSTYVLLLTGVVFNAFAASLIMFMKAVVNAQKAQELLFYLMGTLSVESTSTAETLVVVALATLSIAGVMVFARDLNVMALGDESALALGVDVERVRRRAVVLSSLGVAVSVAYTGLIGFVGLVVPHGIRLAIGPDHRILLPLCAILGGAFMVTADVLARMSFDVFGTTLPVGVVTAFIGAPLFVYFLRRHLRGESA